MDEKLYDERVKYAVSLFKSGYNCAQSVFVAFSDMYGMDKDTSLRVASSFGGGIGRMRETCGAACGLFMLAGLYSNFVDPTDKASKNNNYKLVQELAKRFKEKNGSVKCSDLLGLSKEHPITYVSQERTSEYYQKRPCPQIVEEAAKIWVSFLEEK